ncbi:acetate--CoA ligase family protein [Aestuariivirga litoralis]|uniref:acetate--CoA ligase family protein n=1 Tax=Aestuariivirga litoralis TaxID=2650924 RepID=UPI0018C71F1D|nr:acetate--CoA ligase family protein [Aestuariivirga litoralis]MBG1231264.1 acetate--CoA ligase family protein [Aestuariivirga litoralis]
MSLSRFLNPKSIVFVGGNECAIAIKRTREFEFPGNIYAVHPKREELGGIKTVKSVDEIEGPIDAAFIAVKREPAVEIVRQLRAKGCGGAVIYAAGFAEAGATDLQAELLKAADGMPLMGPNCYGFVNGLSRAALWPDEHGIQVRDKGVAIITQSGNIAVNLTTTQRELPLAAIFTMGNQADVDITRMVDTLVDDPRVTAIGLHIEGIKNVSAFAAVAAKARSKKKPIVAIKTGKSEQGAKVTMSHTSSLSGADQLYDAMFERYGIARVTSVTALAEALKLLHHGGPLPGGRLVSHSCSGGEAALIADMAVGRKVSFPPFKEETKPKIKQSLNEFVSVDNPFDYHTFIWNDEEKLTATFTATLSGGFDCGVLILDTPALPQTDPAAWLKTARAFSAAAKANKSRAVVLATFPENMTRAMMVQLTADGIAPMMGFDDTLTALEAAAFIGENWARNEPPPTLRHPDKSGYEEAKLLTEAAGKQLLKSHGLTVPEGAVVKIAEAGKASAKLGFPVVVKTSSESIAHKTEAGGVALNLKTEAEAQFAANKMAELGPEVLVEKMVQGAVTELIVGVKRDPQFGLALVVGAGGILTELLKDSATLLLPTSRAEITRALQSLRIWKLVEGFRGKKGDTESVITAIEAVAAFAAAHEATLEELDINPLFVLSNGTVAADALIRKRS